MGGNVHGADLEALDGLRRTVERNAGTLRSLTESATAGVATLTTIWDGPDAGQFRQQWMGIHQSRLLAAVDGLLARVASRHAVGSASRRSEGAAPALTTPAVALR